MTWRLDERTGVVALADDAVHETNVVRAGDTILVTVADPDVPLDQLAEIKKNLEARLPEDVRVQVIVGAQVTIVRGDTERDGTIGGSTP